MLVHANAKLGLAGRLALVRAAPREGVAGIRAAAAVADRLDRAARGDSRHRQSFGGGV